jgi:Protein of unknown function (DUF1572)
MQNEAAAHFIEMTLREYRHWKTQAERALAQTDDRAFFTRLDGESNSIALVVKHVAGNMKSRWTDFLTTDGEKASRDRDNEFEDTGVTRAAILESWEEGWRRTLVAIEALTADDLMRTVTIAGKSHTVVQAIGRNLTHTASHVGQIVLLAKHFAGSTWQTLSIPRRTVKKA